MKKKGYISLFAIFGTLGLGAVLMGVAFIALISLVQASKVQTLAVQQLTDFVSDELDAQVQVGKVDYAFFNNLELTDILVLDQQSDTLLAADTVAAHFSFWKFFKKEIRFDRVELKHVTSHLYQLPIDSLDKPEWNFGFIAQAFKSDKPKQKLGVELSLKNVQLTDAHLVVRLPKDTFDLRELNATLSLNDLTQHVLDAEIEHLSFVEANGFALQQIEARLFADEQQAVMTKMTVALPQSRLDLDTLRLIYADEVNGEIQNRELYNIEFQFGIREGHIVPSELERFVPLLASFTAPIDFSIQGSGRVDSVYLRDCEVDYDAHPILRGEVCCFGLPDWQTAYIKASLTDLRIELPIMQDVIARLQQRPYQLPDPVKRLGTLHYQGQLSGKAEDLRLIGRLSCRLGSVITNGQLQVTDSTRLFAFVGNVRTSQFRLGEMLAQPDLNRISLDATLDGSVGVEQPMQANLQAAVPLFEYKQQQYHSLQLNGNYVAKRWEGEIAMNDSLISFNFNGLADFSKRVPEIDAQLLVHDLHLGEILQLPQYPDAVMRCGIRLNGKGKALDYIDGTFQIDTLYFSQGGKQLYCPFFRVQAETDERTALKIQSPFITANLYGDYRYSRLKQNITNIAARVLPSVIGSTINVVKENRDAMMDMYIYCSNLDSIFNVLDLPLRMPGMQTVRGYVLESSNYAGIQMVVPQINYKDKRLRELTVDVTTTNTDELKLAASFINKSNKSIRAGQQMGDIKFLLLADMQNDTLEAHLDFQNIDTLHNEGHLNVLTHFAQYNKKPLIDVHILPSEFVLADSTFTLRDSHLVYNAADTTLSVQHFELVGGNQSVYANGLASTSENDSIFVRLQNVDLYYALSYTNVINAVSFGGGVTGWATVYSLFKEPKFEADVTLPNATFNGYPFGDAYAKAKWNREGKSIDIVGDVFENQRLVAHTDGKVDFKKRHWGLDIVADSVNLQFINRWTSGILTIEEARGFGHVDVGGIMGERKTYVTCRAKAVDAALGVDVLGTTYYFSDSIFMDTTAIRFEDIDLVDRDGNPLHLDGKITHDGQWQDLKYHINVDAYDALVMDLPEDKDNFFYGQVYANGKAEIAGDVTECRINAAASTAKNTDFRLSFSSNNYAKSNDFVTFIDRSQPQQAQVEEDDGFEIVAKPHYNTNILLNLQVEATHDAAVSLILDNRTGDELVGKGEGNINISYDVNADNIQMRGVYEVEQGNFHFTFQNIIQKDFAITPGSRVIWNGDPEDPEIDAMAYYATTASLKDLFGTDYEQVGTNRSSVPVHCLLYLRDKIMNPTISFGLELPQSDDAIRSQVNSVISTEEMLVRQILYLLIFNRFYTPDYLLNDNTVVGLNETYSLLSSTLTAQINNWIQKLTKNFSVGFNIRTEGQGSDASQEYETQFQIQPVSRLLINGNFGYRYNDIANQPIFGNLDVEYLLSENGHWRAKAYTHTVDKYSVRQAQMIEGLGLMFKYDFMTYTPEELQFYRQQRKLEREAKKLERQEKRAARQAKRETKSASKSTNP